MCTGIHAELIYSHTGFGSNFSGAASCLPHQLVCILFYMWSYLGKFCARCVWVIDSSPYSWNMHLHHWGIPQCRIRKFLFFNKKFVNCSSPTYELPKRLRLCQIKNTQEAAACLMSSDDSLKSKDVDHQRWNLVIQKQCGGAERTEEDVDQMIWADVMMCMSEESGQVVGAVPWRDL